MDFYYAMTNYHIICCLLHKMTINKNKAVLYISSYIQHNQPYMVENIVNSGIFEEVHFYEEIEYKKTQKTMNSTMVNAEINRICKEVEKKVGKKIKEANNIYLCSDFYSIGLYTITNKIKYNYFEDGCGIISKSYIPMKIIEKENPNRAIIVKKVKAFGENDYVINRFVSLKNQEKGYYNKKDKEFSVKDIMKKLSSNEINKILKIYNAKKINIKDNKAILLLTLHYNDIMGQENQEEIYKTLIDYFLSENESIIIKPHPADSIWNYEEIFKGCKVINRYMPSELFPYCINNTFEKGITCWSTSVYSLKDILKEIINFDIRIDDTYKDFDKYYAIVEYLKTIKKQEKINIIYKNVNEIQFEQLFKQYFSNYKKYYTIEKTDSKDNIYIVNNITNELKNEKVISLTHDFNSDEVILINKKNDKEEKKLISIYNVDNSKKMNIHKNLKYSNYKLEISNLNNSEQKIFLNDIIKQQKLDKKNKIDYYENKIKKLELLVEEKNEYINKIHNSSSWKVTAIFRRVMDKFRKIKNIK